MQPLELLRSWVLRQAGDQADWFAERLEVLGAGPAERELHIVLGLAPRRLGKADLVLSESDEAAAQAARPGWRPRGWSVDGAARVAALLAYRGQRPFAETFKDLRRTSDVAEMIALYRGLPLYPQPEGLEFEVGEGLRSNIVAVFEAITHNNPYPRDHFDEHRWNHMILKALFVGSRIAPVLGIDARANAELARIMRDFAHERWAAGRIVPAELWRCVGPFADDEAALDDLGRALAGGPAERAAAALALSASPATGAAAILAAAPDLARAVADGTLCWDALPETEEEAA
jgi:hypothetical protein